MSADTDVKEAPVASSRAALPTMMLHELNSDTHGTLRRFRRDHSVVRHEKGSYYVLRMADIERCSKDPRLVGSGTAVPKLMGFEQGAVYDVFGYGMLWADGDTHRRRRAPFSKLFAARAIAEMRPRIRRTVENIIDEWQKGEVDLVAALASPLPARIIADLLGLPEADIPDFTRDVYEATKVFVFGMKPDELGNVELAAQSLRDYVARTLDDRRRNPRDDFLTAFLAAADAAGELSPEEIIFQIFLLIGAGTDTTRVAMAMLVTLLLQHREQWEAVSRDPALIPGAVAEALRFEPSTSGMGRIAAEDIEIEGAIIPAGSFVTLSTLSGMRDERMFDRPDTFDIGRKDQMRMHVVFGHGVHRCLGEALARAELEEGLAVLTARIPQLQLDVGPKISGHFGIRRIDSMRVSWKP